MRSSSLYSASGESQNPQSCTCKQSTIESGCVLEHKIKSALYEVVETGRPAPCASTLVSFAVSRTPSVLLSFSFAIRISCPFFLLRSYSISLHCTELFPLSLFFFPSPGRDGGNLAHRYRATCARKFSLSLSLSY